MSFLLFSSPWARCRVFRDKREATRSAEGERDDGSTRSMELHRLGGSPPIQHDSSWSTACRRGDVRPSLELAGLIPLPSSVGIRQRVDRPPNVAAATPRSNVTVNSPKSAPATKEQPAGWVRRVVSEWLHRGNRSESTGSFFSRLRQEERSVGDSLIVSRCRSLLVADAAVRTHFIHIGAERGVITLRGKRADRESPSASRATRSQYRWYGRRPKRADGWNEFNDRTGQLRIRVVGDADPTRWRGSKLLFVRVGTSFSIGSRNRFGKRDARPRHRTGRDELCQPG